MLVTTIIFLLFSNFMKISQKSEGTGVSKVLFIVRTHDGNWKKLEEQASSWLYKIPPTNLIISTSPHISDKVLPTWLKFLEPSIFRNDCPSGHSAGPACVEAKALIAAVSTREIDFSWAFIIDDDVWARPYEIELALENKDPTIAYGTPGCVSDGLFGFCGGGGYAISKFAILNLFRSTNFVNFFDSYMNLTQRTQNCDITTAQMLVNTNIRLKNMKGLHPWEKNETSLSKINNYMKEGNSVLSLHYASGKMFKYNKLFWSRSKGK
jgi:hypothetical protein